MRLSQYEGKIVGVIDVDGQVFTGVPVSFPAEYGLHEFNREEESVKPNDYQLFESDIGHYLRFETEKTIDLGAVLAV